MKLLKELRVVFIFVIFMFGCATDKIFTYKDFGMENENIRVIFVKVVVDDEYKQKNKNWRERIIGLFDEVSAIYEKQFKIKLVLKDIKEWSSESDNSNRMAMFHEVKKKFQITPEVDVVVAFTNQKTNYIWWHGTAEQLGNYVLVGVSGGDNFFERRIITHEVGHLFGAIDYDGYHGSPFSVMNYDFFKETDYFDAESVKIIMKNKFRNFHKAE